jgi:cytidylate kinase
MMNKRLTIAIDGPASSGKGTVARRVAERLGYLYLDSGAMYRALTLLSIQKGVSPTDVPALIRLAQSCRIDFADNGKVTLLNGEDVSDAIRTPEIDRVVSDVSKVPEVRREIVKQQRRIGEKGGIIAEGRDVTTVVFPNADHKFYLDATVQERARRRFVQLKAKGIDCALAQVEADIRIRDQKDSSREHSPLRTAEDAIVIDTTHQSIEPVVDFILKRIRGI